MNMNFKLNIEQSQKLVISQQLKQSLQILNMTLQELEVEILKESLENPVLEVEEKRDDIDWEKFIEHVSSGKSDETYTAYSNDEDRYSMENFVGYEAGMYEYLKGQAGCMLKNEAEMGIALEIINSLDERGYLPESTEEIATRLGVPEEKVMDMLVIVQSLDPAGIGARSLSECLVLQLHENGIIDDRLENIINSDLEMLSMKKHRELCKKYKIDIDTLRYYIEIIRTLEPMPGRVFSNERATYVTPDVIVEKVDGDFEVYLNEYSTPRIRINDYYKSLLKSAGDDAAKEYIKQKLGSAANLIRNIESRKSTILGISMEILKRQRAFFEKGVNHLKPMIMKDIAQELGFHESTVSRAVNGKYMLTPHGLFELRFFFSGSPSCDDIAANSIKNILREIIDKEDKKKPLSDQAICKLLENKGIDISRRTVAKYRDELGILSSSQRKQA
ncbi:putative RNA polymerase sigma-54 factor RpoN [Peptoclostridium acidaminophilum DSM 3953]|uniref:Putative RNA polymerase sigma-54 factor RpoN n=2 Tax=Peptoclostridium acidaminophilum TaxID=1731 RepID=W8TGB9_PEPAC|nr:putative RNA polymerase sigma-54 factor RpoN [Peptoclostridium acidaminophilum DSM 3953]